MNKIEKINPATLSIHDMQIKIYDEQDDFEVDNICLSSYDIEDDEDMQRLMSLIQDVIVDYLESQQDI